MMAESLIKLPEFFLGAFFSDFLNDAFSCFGGNAIFFFFHRFTGLFFILSFENRLILGNICVLLVESEVN